MPSQKISKQICVAAKTGKRQRLLAATAFFAVLAVAGTARAQVQFQDVSEDVGMTGFTESWGANFGDLNGDNCLDIFVNGHRDYPRVYRNTCTGEFEDIATQMDDGTWMDKPADDKHGGSFGDFDNDGDKDILLGVSVSGPGQLWVNQGDGTFSERASDFGVSSDYAARVSNWMDFTNDGMLDTLQFGLEPRSYARYQTPFGTFSSSVNTDHQCDEGDINFIQLLDITGDGTLEMVCIERGSFPYRAYETGTLPFNDVTSQLPSFGNVNGVIMGDFDGNLRTDILMTRGATRPAGAAQVNNTRVEAWIEKDPGDPPRTGFVFQSAGEITVTVWSRDLSRNQPPHVMNVPFGGSQCSDSSRFRVCADYNIGQNRWEVYMAEGGQSYVVVEAAAAITGLDNVGETNRDRPIEARLYLNTPAGFVYNTSMGLTDPVTCGGGAAADFDNDMDIDLYLSCGRGPENLPNRMYINQGNGTFVLQAATGAEGPTGIGFDKGVAENVTYGDYDLDGFLDIFVTNGLLYYPWGLGGPDILLNNQGNSNHWLQFDLEGVASNRDGIGAKVYVTANGVEQFREQNGGYNRWGQNQQWLHFGLAGNTTADVRIEWPSGAVDVHSGVAADALYRAVEGGALVPQSQGAPITTILNPGDECGEPAYDFDFGPANLLWRDCGTNTWHFRSKGGRVNPPQRVTQGSIVADAPFSGVVGVDLNGSDTVDNSTPEVIDFDIRVNGTNDQGFDFDISGQDSSCLDFSRQDIKHLIIGASGKQVETPLDLVTLWDCGAAVPPDLSIAGNSAPESDGSIDFTVTLAEISAVDVTFEASTQDITASYLAGDYTQLNGAPYTIPAGDLSTTVTVIVNNEQTAEHDEEFTVSLSNIANARFAGGPATGTILNDDGDLPELRIADAQGLEDSGGVDLVITLNKVAYEDISFEILTAGQTASYLSDYQAIISEQFIIPAGDQTLIVPLIFNADTDIEDDELLLVGLSDFTNNVDPVDPVAAVYILNDDGDTTPRLSISDVSADEDTGLLSFTVSVNEALTEDVTFQASTSDGTATTADSDYTALVNQPGTITAGALSTTVSVIVGVDSDPEPDETLTVTLSNASPNVDVLDGTATGTIINDDIVPVVSISDAQAEEDTGTMTFTVSLDVAADADITFDASTADDTATAAGGDYTALTNQGGTITAGDLSTTVTVTIGTDADPEPDETFFVNLSNISANAIAGDDQAMGTIRDDDNMPNLSIADVSAAEDTGELVFTVSLSTVTVADVTFEASTTDGSATTADSDYAALVSQAGTISAGDLSTTVTVLVGVDSDIEPDETLTVTLANVSPNAFVQDGTATGTIENDDATIPDLSIADATALEDSGTLTFTVSLSEAAASDVTFDASTADDTATEADGDYTGLVSAPHTISAGDLSTTVSVSLGVDADVEPDETLTVQLSNVSANAFVTDNMATGTIENDDSPAGPTVVDIDDWYGIEGGVSVAGNRVSYDGSTPQGWNSGAFSAPLEDFGLTDDYEVRFTIQGDPTNTIWVAGLGVVESDSNFRDIDYGLRSSNGQLMIYENGGWQFSGAALADGDEISIFVSGASIEYRHNGAAVYNSTTSGAPSFYVDTAFKVGSIALDVVAEGDVGPVVPPSTTPITSWVNEAGGVSAAGSDLFFSGTPTNWTSTINSVPLSSLGAGGTFTVSWEIDSDPAGTIWVVGLGVTETSSQRNDIDYGLRSSNGTLQIRENGVWVANAGSLQVGDVLGVRVDGTTLEYQLNGIAIGSATIAGGESFYIDTAFKTGPISLGSFTLSD